jgi:hypothetical protein
VLVPPVLDPPMKSEYSSVDPVGSSLVTNASWQVSDAGFEVMFWKFPAVDGKSAEQVLPVT